MNKVKVMGWDNKYSSYSVEIGEWDCRFPSQFEKFKQNFQSANGFYEVSLLDDSGVIDLFHSEDIDFL